ncbi:hypothetical protein [Paenibacillus ehimensis]|uniref:2TM domain-containing protein n=1 Tax=Paenibacillus ehimensis TaxID=79264 RepID=A0ABT8VBW3_9BACL|nr:hypothetical protein [Paenibacillus ehimensis]MDO3678486.1 hypothetical protein [Paenibacillus ehimensis]MEC0214016.1 hypothetical protein [Paenibacillus ehimensis]
MSTANEDKAAKWQKTRQLGKAKYVMYYGVAMWGISLAVLFTAIEWLTQQTLTPSWFTIRIIVFGIIGFFIANFRWDGNERKYAPRPANKKR